MTTYITDEDFKRWSKQRESELRDQFAGLSLAAIICEPIDGVQESVAYELSDNTAEAFARAAYKFADAMLKVRAK